LPAAPGSGVSFLETPGVNLMSLAQYFTFGRDRLFDLAAPSLRTLMGSFRSRSLMQLCQTERVLAKAGVKACVVTAPLGLEAVNALVAARRASMPAVVLQHGGFNGYADFAMLPFTDFGVNDHYLCYGPGVSKNLAPLASRLTPVRNREIQVRAIGSASIYAIYRARKSASASVAKRRVIYVPSFLSGSGRYLAGHHRADIGYWRLQRCVLTLLASRKDWDVQFCPAPKNFVANPVLPWLTRQQGWHVRLRQEMSFGELLQRERFDLIVTDAVTTVLLEALATGASVVAQFDGAVMKVQEDALALLQRRAKVSFTDAAFLADISTALDNEGGSEAIDDAFLFQYALTGPNEDPASLQVAALKSIVDTSHAAN
jgi:hypothetical protein